MTDTLWQRLAEQIPVVVLFVFFVIILFREFLKEMARKDQFLQEAINKLLEDANQRGTVRDANFIRSFEKMTLAHNKGLSRLAQSIKKCEMVEIMQKNMEVKNG